MLQYVETFCAVVEAGSFNLAAERLHLSQPAISKQIKAMEAELGVQLLLRSARGVELTPVGRQIHRMARRALAVEEGCQRAAEAWKGEEKGRLVVGAGLTLILFTLPPVIQAFRERVPGVQLEVVTGDSRESLGRLLSFQVDVALVTSPVPHPEVQPIPLFIDPLVVVAAPGIPLPQTIPDLGDAPLIAFRRGSGIRQYVDQVLEGRGARPQVAMEFDSIEAIKTMAGLGLGLALLPLSAVREEVAHGRLAMIRLPDWPDAGRSVTLLRRRAGLRSGAVSRFSAIARDVLATP